MESRESLQCGEAGNAYSTYQRAGILLRLRHLWVIVSTDLDVTVARHPALIVQSTAETPLPNEQKAVADALQSASASASLGIDGISIACISASPTAQECG